MRSNANAALTVTRGLSLAPTLTDMVTDGANRIGDRNVSAFPSAAWGVLAALATVALLSRRRPIAAAVALSAAILAIPGYTVIVAQRAGSPGRGEHAAALIEAFREDVESFAKAHGCAQVKVSQCIACDPVVGFALATTPRCEAPASIVLGPDALSRPCVADGATLTCGTVEVR